MPLGIIKLAALIGWGVIELTRETIKSRRIAKELKLKEGKNDEKNV